VAACCGFIAGGAAAAAAAAGSKQLLSCGWLRRLSSPVWIAAPHPLDPVMLLQILEDNADPSQPFPSVWTSLPTILSDTARLAGVGAGVGLGMSMALGYLLR